MTPFSSLASPFESVIPVHLTMHFPRQSLPRPPCRHFSEKFSKPISFLHFSTLHRAPDSGSIVTLIRNGRLHSFAYLCTAHVLFLEYTLRVLSSFFHSFRSFATSTIAENNFEAEHTHNNETEKPSTPMVPLNLHTAVTNQEFRQTFPSTR